MAEQEKAAQNQQPQFMIQKIYTKDISFETPKSPEIFREEWKPELDMQLTNEYKQLDDEHHDVEDLMKTPPAPDHPMPPGINV